ncbi:MAG: GntR family transcriptional regulator [Lachnospiraceae bacterium]|jgi:GntR family transcriptional regulator|nr:GntR family transcriptional regulator [Lachnospiraceae bacterium]
MFQIDSFSRVPVYEQIINQLEHFILTGILVADTQIPSVRNLSVSLSINPNTIQKAYAELDRNGIIYSVPGRGCFITKEAKGILSSQKQEKLSTLKELVSELKLAGLPFDRVMATVKEVYNLKEDNKND